MIKIQLPGRKTLELKHLVMDFNGTMACDGELLPGIDIILEKLSKSLTIHVITADTFGDAQTKCTNLPVKISILPEGDQDKGKYNFIKSLGLSNTVTMGNGKNDRLMLKYSEIGIALIQDEGASTDALLSADIICKSIISALNLLTNPKRLIATLRI